MEAAFIVFDSDSAATIGDQIRELTPASRCALVHANDDVRVRRDVDPVQIGRVIITSLNPPNLCVRHRSSY
jgi:hypothetical protein